MRDFLGKLTALDPDASDTLKVVGYFDALTARGVGLGSLLRAAAALSGTVAVAEVNGRRTAYDPEGKRLAEVGDRPRGSLVDFLLGAVWLAREGEPHAGDAMVTDRLAIAVEALESRQGSTKEVEEVIDAQRSAAERRTALVRLGIDPAASVRVVVSSADPGIAQRWTALTPTPLGMLHTTLEVRHRGAIRQESSRRPRRSAEVVDGPHVWGAAADDRVGIGTWVRADRAPESWEAALIAHRLLGEGPVRVLDATDLGGMLILARAYDPDAPHPDVLALSDLDDHTADILRTLVDSESVRAAATKLAMHHSTVQARHESLIARLGYDPRSTVGRMRYICAEFLRRLGG